jgi:choline dehydrogenase-like flavoprotein
VGVEPTGEVRPNGDLRLRLRRPDLQRLQEGLVTLARAFFDPRNPDPTEEVLIPTREGLSLRSAAEVEHYARTFTDLRALSVGTGHPQGGNCLSEDPRIGVVGADFRVHGVDNLFVCDASVFPASAGVNPQWTVLALAHLFAQQRPPPPQARGGEGCGARGPLP